MVLGYTFTMNAIATVTWQTLTGEPCCQVDAGCIGVAIVSKAAEIGTWKYTQTNSCTQFCQ